MFCISYDCVGSHTPSPLTLYHTYIYIHTYIHTYTVLPQTAVPHPADRTAGDDDGDDNDGLDLLLFVTVVLARCQLGGGCLGLVSWLGWLVVCVCACVCVCVYLVKRWAGSRGRGTFSTYIQYITYPCFFH